MIPRTKLQKKVEFAAKHLPEINEKQKLYAFRHCFNHIVFINAKGEAVCGECGHVWNVGKNGKTDVCPHCETKIDEQVRRRKKDKQVRYYSMITTCKGFQVFRLFIAYVWYKKNEKSEYRICEVVQRWMSEDGTTTVRARPRLMSCYYDMWNLYEDLSVKPSGYAENVYNIWSDVVYPHKSILLKLKRNGFNGNDCGADARKVCFMLLNNSHYETMYKAGQYELVGHFCNSYRQTASEIWPAIKIAIRNHYHIADAPLWVDYVNALKESGKDIRNASYVCPKNLKEAHDKIMEKKRRERERIAEERRRIDEERRRRNAVEEEADFLKMKGRFIGLTFSDALIQIHALGSVAEHQEEGNKMHHCVYQMGYYKKPDSLILSATINGERIETIEVNLKTLKVVQSRSACNGISPYHERIINLVNQNSNLIRSRMNAAA